MGALGAVVGYAVGGLPIWGHLPLALAAGALGGALWGAIPGVLKARFGAHEVITIMMNYIAIKLVDYLVKQVLRDPTASMDRTRPFCLPPPCRTLGPATRLHAGLLIALAAVVLSPGCSTRRRLDSRYGPWVSISAAQYAGMHVARTLVCTMALSGMLAGLAEPWKSSACTIHFPPPFRRATALTRSPSLYWPNHVPSVSFPLPPVGGLRNGAGLMQVRTGVSIDLINVIQALVIMGLVADHLVRALRRRRVGVA